MTYTGTVGGGTLIVTKGADGKWTYEYQPSESEKDNSFQKDITLVAKDGDQDTDSIKLTVGQELDPTIPSGSSIDATLETDESYIPGKGSQSAPSDGDNKSWSHTDSGSFTVDLHGEHANGVITITHDTHKLTLKYEDGQWIAEPSTGVSGQYGTLTATATQDGNNVTVEYTYTQTKAYDHLPNDGVDQSQANADSFTVSVSDGGDNPATGTITVNIEDDGPVVTGYSSTFSMDTSSSDSQKIEFDFNNPNVTGNNDIDNNWNPENFEKEWIQYNGHFIWDHGTKEIGYEQIEHKNSGIKISAAVVTLEGDNLTIYANNDNDPNNYQPVLTFISVKSDSGAGSYSESGIAVYSGESGPTIDGSDGEIGNLNGTDISKQEAIKIQTPDKNAHFVTITLNAFYDNSTEDEKACVVFCDKEGNTVAIRYWDAQKDNEGISISNTFYVKEGFYSAYIIPVGEKSDFLLNGVTIDYDDNPLWTLSGTISSISADKISNYTFYNENNNIIIDGNTVILNYIDNGKIIEFQTITTDDSSQQISLLGQATINNEGQWSLNWYDNSISPEGINIPVTIIDGDGDQTTINIIVSGTDVNYANVNGTIDSDGISGTCYNDILTGNGGDDLIYGQDGDDLLIGDLLTLNDIESVLNIQGDNYESIANKIKTASEEVRKQLIDTVEQHTTNTDGDDQIFGGTGDDVLIGMGGNDYLNGVKGEDAIFGGAGNDIIVYDQNDYMVSGGSGIDFMVSNGELDLDTLLGNENGSDPNRPIVDGIEVLITGKDATSLTNINQLAEQYGITLGKKDGEDTLTLDMTKWASNDDNTFTYTGGGADLTLQTTLRPEPQSDQDAVQQQVFILQNQNG